MFTLAEKLENVNRTIEATIPNIEAKQAEIEKLQEELRNLKSANYRNECERSDIKGLIALESSPKARWNRAAKALRKDGVHFRTNMMKCCRSCITEADLGLKDDTAPYGYTFGGQGGAIKFNEDGLPYQKAGRSGRRYGYDYETPVEAYINHGNGAGEKIAAAFRAEGFDVDYDGSEYKTVTVKF